VRSGGGGCNATCALNRTCSAPGDCKTGVCSGGLCRQPATCANGARDANEGDVDCGELCDAKCGVAASCRLNADCKTGNCSAGVCQPLATCANGMRDAASEGDVDCGELCSRLCEVTLTCRSSADCASGVCSGGRCAQPPQCFNGAQDRRETDVDWCAPRVVDGGGGEGGLCVRACVFQVGEGDACSPTSKQRHQG
jgi:hypothetical protein